MKYFHQFLILIETVYSVRDACFLSIVLDFILNFIAFTYVDGLKSGEGFLPVYVTRSAFAFPAIFSRLSALKLCFVESWLHSKVSESHGSSTVARFHAIAEGLRQGGGQPAPGPLPSSCGKLQSHSSLTSASSCTPR